MPKHVATDMKSLRQNGFNLVVHTYNENDQLFYKRTMNEIVRITKEEGFEVHVDPWGVGKVFGGESFSNFVACNLDCLQILSDGKPAGTACPMNPKFREYMLTWIEDALETGADKIFWDEPHFNLPTFLGGRPGTWGCRCQHCQQHFEARYGHAMPNEKTAEVKEYLEWGIRDFLQYCIWETKKRGGNNALCLLPHEGDEAGAMSDYNSFASMKGLDLFGFDPYFDFWKKPLEHVTKFSKVTKDCADSNGIESQIWFQGFKIAAGREHLQAEAVELAYKAGITNFAVWGVDACDHMAWIRPDDPQKLWNTFLQAFAKIRELESISTN
ncbi:MAG: hypothetical protein ACFCU1_08285 [Sumerlaeia bacterium]